MNEIDTGAVIADFIYSRSKCCNICGDRCEMLINVADYSLCERCFEDLKNGEIQLDNGESCA